MFVTTTSYSVSGSTTTSTNVISTSQVILGCDVQDTTQTTTGTTSTATGTVVITLSVDANDAYSSGDLNAPGAVATSVYNYVESFWSGRSRYTGIHMYLHTLRNHASKSETKLERNFLTSYKLELNAATTTTTASSPFPTESWILAIVIAAHEFRCKLFCYVIMPR